MLSTEWLRSGVMAHLLILSGCGSELYLSGPDSHWSDWSWTRLWIPQRFHSTSFLLLFPFSGSFPDWSWSSSLCPSVYGAQIGV